MPFFLVTHKSLVEADSDHEAAVKALQRIENGGKLEFEVKFDEATITLVVLSGREVLSRPPEKQEQLRISEAGQPAIGLSETMTSIDQSLPGHPSDKVWPKRPDKRITTIVSVFLGGLVLMTLLLGSL